LTPAVSAGAISSEREQLTYDLLVATPLRPGRILSGKLIGTLSYILLLIFAAVPLGSLVLVFGGVAPEELLQALVLMLVTALTFGMIGLLCSALVRRTITATILAYAIVLLMIAGSYFAVALGTAAHPNQTPAPSRLVALSPFSAMVSIVAQGMQPGGGAVTMPALGMAMPDAPVPGVAVEGLIRPMPMPMPPMMDGAGPGLIMNMPGLSMLSMGLVEYGPNGPVMLPMYRWTIVGYALLGLGCYWVASHLVRPRRRWRLDRHDLLMLATVVVVAGLGTQWLGLSSVLRGRLGL
jgi:hypothetical protein